MRSLLVSCVAFALFTGLTAAQAERRTFIVANNADGYGVDRCLARGEKCGQALATHFCKIRDFKRAVTFHKINKGETVTGAVPLDAYACSGRKCGELVAIECVR